MGRRPPETTEGYSRSRHAQTLVLVSIGCTVGGA